MRTALVVVVLALVLGDLFLFYRTRSVPLNDNREPEVVMGMATWLGLIDRHPDPKRWPSLDGDGKWVVEGKPVANIRAFQEHSSGPNIDTPDSWIRVRLGEHATLGQFIATLKSLRRLGLCDYGLQEDAIADPSDRFPATVTVRVQSVDSSWDENTSTRMPCAH
jgi:hypothetical protein